MARGDQKPENLPIVRVSGSGFVENQQVVKFPRNTTPFECSYFVKNGIPDPKTAKISVFQTNEYGKQAILIASVDINFSMHFGAQFETGESALEPTAVAHARGLICEKISYKAVITPKKDKDMEALKECVKWRQAEH